jgi:serine/threonine-protein kinase
MGEVVAARDLHLGREIAVKRMLASDPSERALFRFLREARIQARLDHPAIVPVYDVGRDSHGRPYFTMKKVNGTNLAELLRRSGGAAVPSRPRLLRAFVDVCLAIELAHTRGVVHRDLKPENLVLGDFGEVYVLDWGVARVIGESDDFADVGGAPYYSTADGAMLGTPGYMAPEQIRADIDLDGAADVYSLGCVLFEILTGAPLHPAGKAGLASALAGIDCRPSSRVGDVPPELDEVCVRATGERHQRPSARELGERVQRFLDGDRDVTLRNELARQHLSRARVAYQRGDDTFARGIAMREAGRALALDPSLAGPAELVGRMMLEPPRETPREVEAALEADAAAGNRNQARAALFMSLGYLAFVPFLAGFRGTNLYAAGFAAYVLANGLLMLLRAHGRGAAVLHAPWCVALRNAILIGALGSFFSPFQIAPGLAAVTTAALINAPMFQRPRSILILMISMLAAILLPWLAEHVGLLPTTFTFTDGGAVIQTPELATTAAARAVGWATFSSILLAAATMIAYFVRRNERESRRRLHLYAWHLRQLVP